MGAFFTNVQVRIARGGDIASVARVLRELLAEGDYTMARDDEPADRTVLLSRSGDWVAVYDEGTDTGAVALDDLADVLSRALETHALAVRVHDSDVLEIELFENGDLLDRYNSAPDYFGEVSDEERKELAGEPPRWTAVLAEGHDANELAAVFGESRLFCEETLRKVGALLGIDPAQIGVGYRYAAQGEGPKDRVALRFRLSQRPAYERRRTGAPRLGLPYGFDRMPSPRPGTSYEAMVGSPLQVSARGQNLGGASRGVRVVVEGDALDRDLVRITKVNAVVGVPQEGNWGEGEPSVER